MADGDGRVLLQEQQRHRLADDVRAPDDDGVAPGERHARVLHEAHDAGAACTARRPAARRAARRGSLSWKPSTSFAGAIASRTRAASMCFGSGSCTRMPWTAGSGVQALDALFSRTAASATSCRKLEQLGMHADLGGGQGLVAHVDARGGDRRRRGSPRGPALLRAAQARRPAASSRAKPRGERFSVEDLGCHGGAQSSIGPIFWLSLPRPPQQDGSHRSCPPFHNFPPQTIPTRSKPRNGSTRSKRCSSAKGRSARTTCSSG